MSTFDSNVFPHLLSAPFIKRFVPQRESEPRLQPPRERSDHEQHCPAFQEVCTEVKWEEAKRQVSKRSCEARSGMPQLCPALSLLLCPLLTSLFVQASMDVDSKGPLPTQSGDPGWWTQRCSRRMLSRSCAGPVKTPAFAAGILRLWFEAHINTVNDLRQQVERREDDPPKKISHLEREARKARLGERLASAVEIDGMLETADSIINRFCGSIINRFLQMTMDDVTSWLLPHNFRARTQREGQFQSCRILARCLYHATLPRKVGIFHELKRHDCDTFLSHDKELKQGCQRIKYLTGSSWASSLREPTVRQSTLQRQFASSGPFTSIRRTKFP